MDIDSTSNISTTNTKGENAFLIIFFIKMCALNQLPLKHENTIVITIVYRR